MAQTQKVGRYKALQRSARMKGVNAAQRPVKVKRARLRHLKNARRSCGQVFADALEKYYAQHPNPGRKAGWA